MEMQDQPVKPAEMPKAKNPKRVAAGVRSAEVRKAKAADVEELKAQLDKLEQLKLNMRDEQQPTAEPGVINTVTQEPVAQHHDWTPWVVGGLGGAAVLWYLMKPAAAPRARTSTPAAVQSDHPKLADPVLKTRDMFYME